MFHTGIIRRVDDLGRIVIPKEIRNRTGIKEGTPLEFQIENNFIKLVKYVPEDLILDTIKTLELQFDSYLLDDDHKVEDRRAIQEHIKAIKILLKKGE